MQDMGTNFANNKKQGCNVASLFAFAERLPPAMRVRRKKLYFWLENKPPDERAKTGSPTVYEFVHREVLLV